MGIYNLLPFHYVAIKVNFDQGNLAVEGIVTYISKPLTFLS